MGHTMAAYDIFSDIVQVCFWSITITKKSENLFWANNFTNTFTYVDNSLLIQFDFPKIGILISWTPAQTFKYHIFSDPTHDTLKVFDSIYLSFTKYRPWIIVYDPQSMNNVLTLTPFGPWGGYGCSLTVPCSSPVATLRPELDTAATEHVSDFNVVWFIEFRLLHFIFLTRSSSSSRISPDGIQQIRSRPFASEISPKLIIIF